jgi:A/G-specific adenine glycosylase
VSRWCAALKSDRVAHLPVFGAKKTPLAVSRVAAVVRCGALLLLAQRRPEGLFGGMWEPPMVDAEALASAREDLSAHGVPRGASMRDLGVVRHTLTHRAMRVVVAGATTSRRWRLPAEPPPPYAQVAWRTPDAVALSTLARKVLRRAEPQSRTAS